MSVQPVTATRRERARAATIEEIKSTALDLMRGSGSTDLRFTDIARVMGMTPPALYRYYADRDALLTDLIADAYDDVGRTVAEARDQVPGGDLWGRWVAVTSAYRSWARREPQLFSLIFGVPVPGYVAPDEGPTTEAAKRAMRQLAALFVRAAEAGELREPLVTEVSPALAASASEKHPELDGVLSPQTFQAMLHTWSSLHGFTCLEAYGHLDWLDQPSRDSLFDTHVRSAAEAAGFPTPS